MQGLSSPNERSRKREILCGQCRTRFNSKDDLDFHKLTTPYCSHIVHKVDAMESPERCFGKREVVCGQCRTLFNSKGDLDFQNNGNPVLFKQRTKRR